MNYAELKDNIAKNDKIEYQNKHDTRKPKLTLRHLQKLRKIRELKELEQANMLRQLELIYATPTQDDGALSGF